MEPESFLGVLPLSREGLSRLDASTRALLERWSFEQANSPALDQTAASFSWSELTDSRR
jgi:hypothetical protein